MPSAVGITLKQAQAAVEAALKKSQEIGTLMNVAVVDAAKSPVGVVTARDALQLDALAFGAELMRREEITVIL